jgi:Xaa-Pro aminopeptidase
MDYSRFLDELYVIRDLIGDRKPSSKKSSLAQTLKLIQLSPPPSARANSSAQLTAALEDAKSATEQYGIASSQARLAWETYEEIAASGNDNAIGINLLEECSVESGQDACRAMEEMDRILPILLAISSK